LNQKHKWDVKGKYNGRYIANFIDGEYIDTDIITINLWAFFIIWPLYLTGVLAIIGGKKVYHRYLKDRFSIPEDK
jgi:hypothetical protein